MSGLIIPNAENTLGTEQVDQQTGLDFSTVGAYSPYVGSFTSPIDPTEYTRYIDEVRPELGVDYLDKRRAVNQGGLEQFGAFLNQAVVGEILGGTIEGLGYLGALGDAGKIITNEDLELGNAVTRLGQNIREWSQDVTPIYETRPGEFAPGNWSWWMKNGVSVASTASLLIPSLGAAKGLSMLGKATGMSLNLGKYAKAAGLGPRAVAIASQATPGVSQAVISRQMESLMEAGGKYEEIYKRNLNLGLSEQDARHAASVAASDIYNKNWALLAQDIFQYTLLGRKFGKASAGLTPGLAKELGKNTLKYKAGTTGRYLLDAMSEGGEEAYQYIVSEMADDLSRVALDPDYKPRHLSNLTNDAEFKTSIAMGMLGAGAFQIAGRQINKALGGVNDEQKRINNLRSWGPTIKMYSEAMRQAEENNDFKSWETLRSELSLHIGGKASELQNLDILVDNLSEVMKQEPNQETLEKFGLDEGDIEFIKETFPTIIEDVQEVGVAYEKYARGENPDKIAYDSDIASRLATLEVGKRLLGKRGKELASKLQSDLNKLEELGFDRLSPAGKDIVRLEMELESLDKVKRYLESRLKDKELDVKVKEKYEKQLAKVNKRFDNTTKQRESYKKDENYSKEDRLNDAEINLNSSLLTEAVKTNTQLDYNNLALSNKDAAIKEAKDIQKARKEGKKPVPQEPEPATQEEVPAEEPTVETTKEETSKTPKETTVETQPYEPDPKDVKRRRKVIDDPDKMFSFNGDLRETPFSTIFDEFESIDAAVNGLSDTGILKKEGNRIYFYSDNLKNKQLYNHLIDELPKYTGIIFLSEPKPYTTEDKVSEKVTQEDETKTGDELDATVDRHPDTEHPDADTELEPENLDPDTILFQGEERLFYKFQKDKTLKKYIEDSNSDFEDATGEMFIDIDNPTISDDTSLKKKLKDNNFSNLTSDELDKIPLGMRIKDGSGTVRGVAYIGTPTNKVDKIHIGDVKAYKARLRRFRSNVTSNLMKGDKVSLKGFRRDSGRFWNVPDTKAKLNVIKALNTSYEDISMGIAVPGTVVDGVPTFKSTVYDRDWNVMPAGANPFGGSVYLSTNKTPNKVPRVFKLNKSKISEDHANIILNAFEQSSKAKTALYEGAEVTGGITNETILDYLVYHGEDTFVSPKRAERIGDPEYIERLRSKQLYRSGALLYYGASGKINLKNITPEARKAFIEYATENFNYSIQLGNLSTKFESPFKIGSWEVTEQDVTDGLTWEQHYLKDTWVWTNVTEDANGNVISDPDIYVSIDNLSNVQVEETKPVEPSDDINKSPDDINKEMLPYTSSYYEGKLHERTSPERQIEQVRELIGRNISIEVVDDFIRVVNETGSHLAFGQVQNGAIKLYERAESGTGYHEAFHIVSLYYLTSRQRKKVYDDAATYYNINRSDERAIEEALAEDFRRYMLSEKRVAPKVKSHRNFFQKLYDFIIDLFINPISRVSNLTIDSLFNSIENGKFKEAKIRNKNLKKYSGYDYLRFVDEFSTEQTKIITDLMMHQMLTLNNIVKLEDINKISLDPVFKQLKDIRDRWDKYRKTEGLSEEYKAEGDRLYSIYDRILKPENIKAFTELIQDQLGAFNIKRQVDKFENSNGIDIVNLFEDNKDGSDLLKYDRASYENSGKDNLLANVKLFIATLPANGELDPYMKMPKMTDFSEAYSMIMNDLKSARNWNDIIKTLEQKSADNLFYRVLLDGNEKTGRVGLKNAPKEFQHQFEIATYMHRHNFVNVVRNNKGDLVFVDAAVSKAERDLAYEWSLRFYLSGKFINEGTNVIDKQAVIKILNKFNTDVKAPLNKDYQDYKLQEFDTHIKNVVDILNEIGVTVSDKDVRGVVKELGRDDKGNINDDAGLAELVNNTLFGFFGIEGALSKIKEAKLDDVQFPEELIAEDSGVINFASLVIANNIYLQDDTVLGAKSNTYYVYAQPNLLTEYVKDLNNDDILRNNLKNVVYNKNSQYLKQLDDGAIFDVVTFASLRERGSSGNDYRDIEPKEDFLMKFSGLFNNYIPLPTLADRKAYYLYKGLERLQLVKNAPGDSYLKNGKYTLGERAVNVLFGYAKDEESRIAKVKKEIEDAKSSGDYTNLVLNQHYKEISPEGVPVLVTSGENIPEGLKYRHFTDFNDPIYNDKDLTEGDRNSLMKEAIRSSLERNIINTIEYAKKVDIISYTKDEKGNITNIRNKDIGANLENKHNDVFK